MRQSPQAIPAHRHPIRENRQSLPFDAMRRSSETLDQNRQHGLVIAATMVARIAPTMSRMLGSKYSAHTCTTRIAIRNASKMHNKRKRIVDNAIPFTLLSIFKGHVS